MPTFALLALLAVLVFPFSTSAAGDGPATEDRGPSQIVEDGRAPAGRVEARTLFVSEAGKQVRHLIYIPSGYAASERGGWPLMVGLHGTAGDPEQVMGFQRLTELADRYGYLLVCPYSSGTGDLHRRYVLQVLADTRRQFAIDPDRIFLLGISRGGAGVWGLGAAHPELWAGLALISPATRSDPAPLDRMRDLPIIVVLGDQDEAVSVRAVRRWVRRMAELDMVYRFVELPGVEHDLSRLNFLPLVFDFFERQTRRND